LFAKVGEQKQVYNVSMKRKLLDWLLYALIGLGVYGSAVLALSLVRMSGEETFRMTQEWKDNPEIDASEVVILTIVRKHVDPPIHPLPVKEMVTV